MIRRLLILALVWFLPSVPSTAQAQSWQTGKILAVEKRELEVPCSYSGSDTPLQSNVETYDVSLQIGNTLYVGRYETSIGYVPTNWAKDRLVLARPMKHFIYLRTPSGEQVRLYLRSRK